MLPIAPILIGLGQNLALLLALLFLYRLISALVPASPPRLSLLVLGALFGGIAILGMSLPIQIAPGIQIDGRTVMVGLAGVFGGPVAAATAGALAASYRLWLGGSGALPGAGAVLTSAALGMLLYWRLGRNGRHVSPGVLLVFGLVLACMSLLWVFALGVAVAWPVLGVVAIPMLIFYPLGTLFLGTLFAQESRQREAEAALRSSAARYRTLASHFPNGAVLLFDHGLRYTLAEGAGLAVAGLSKADLEGKTIWEVYPAETCRLIEPPMRAALAGTPCITEVPFRDRVYRVHTLPVPDPHRHIPAGMVMTQDVTADRQAQAAFKESEERYARLADAAFEGITLCENDIIIDTNARLAAMLGYTREELVGMAAEQLVAPEAREVARKRMQTGYQGRYELLALHKDGHIVPVELQARHAQYQGRPIRVTAIRDISERVAAQHALAASERMFKELVQSVNAVVWEADARTFVFSFVSEQAEKLLGYPTADWIAIPNFWVDRIHPDDRNRAIEYCVECTRALKYHEFEYRMIAADGRVVWLRDLVTVVADDGQPVRLRGVMVDITARKQAEVALEDSEARFRGIFECAAVGIILSDLDGRTIQSNPAVQAMLGYTAEEVPQLTFTDVMHPDDEETYRTLFQELVSGARESYQLEKRFYHKDGHVIWGRLTVSLVRGSDGEPLFTIIMIEDISERKRIEQQYLQSQKMEAIGRLAGGVAHDFNNLLTIILGSSELLLDELGPAHPMRPEAAAIFESGRRAAALTRQLLAFSRKQVLQPESVNLNTVVARVEQLLRRLIGEDIALVTRMAEDLGTVQADPGQLEQVLLNLAVNARDAMPQGGTLIIETADVMLDSSYTHERGDVISGPYVMLAVSDTGCGMDRDTQASIFEPFFTTKEPGQGTGLGLATVYGIIQQSGGHIWVYSEAGQGATFKIYLPHADAPEPRSPSVAGQEPPAHDTGTILLVEDEPRVRELASRVLRAHGYQVLEAGDGVAALRIAGEYAPQIDVLLTDVIMPGGLSGPQLAARLSVCQPGLAVLYMSGYTDTALAQHTLLEQRPVLLQKPFSPAELLRAVWQARRQEQEINR